MDYGGCTHPFGALRDCSSIIHDCAVAQSVVPCGDGIWYRGWNGIIHNYFVRVEPMAAYTLYLGTVPGNLVGYQGSRNL